MYFMLVSNFLCPLKVVELDKLIYAISSFFNAVGRIEIDVFMFDGAPETLYQNIVFTTSIDVHTDLNIKPMQ